MCFSALFSIFSEERAVYHGDNGPGVSITLPCTITAVLKRNDFCCRRRRRRNIAVHCAFPFAIIGNSDTIFSGRARATNSPDNIYSIITLHDKHNNMLLIIKVTRTRGTTTADCIPA